MPEGLASQRSASPIVRDPRLRKQEEGQGEGPAMGELGAVKVKEEVVEPEVSFCWAPACVSVFLPSLQTSSMYPDLAQHTAELSYLGALLGLPSVFDPMFPVAYAAFFGSLPPSSDEPMEDFSTVHTSNVSPYMVGWSVESLYGRMVCGHS